MTGPERIDLIADMQARLETAVARLEGRMVSALLSKLSGHYKNPAGIALTLKTFRANQTIPLVQKVAADVLAIGEANYAYYGKIRDGEIPAELTNRVMSRVRLRFGLDDAGKFTPGGYLDELTADSQISLQIVQSAWKAKVSGQTLEQFTQTLSSAVQGTGQGGGILQRHFRTYAYDTYQQADRDYQVEFAEGLQLEAFRYAGGLVRDSRDFCEARNGKIFLKSEALAWDELEWNGKKKPHNPLLDLGGYGCRHHMNFVSNSTALRERPDLELVDGKLKVKNA